MKDKEKTKEQLISELEELRRRFGDVEKELEESKDITERKRIEEKLREGHKDLNRAQAVAETGSWRLNVRTNELLWSDETHRIFGIPKETPMTYETFIACVHPDDREYVDSKWGAALNGAEYDIEHRIVVNDEIRWVNEKAELEFNQEGVIIGGFGTVRDITECKRVEESYRLLLEEMNDGYGVIQDEKYIFTNRRFCEIFGYEPGQMQGISVPQLTPSDARKAVDDQYKRVMSGQEPVPERHEVVVNKKDGTPITVETNTKIIQYEGKPAAYIIVRDVTERKQMEENYRQLLEDINEGYVVVQDEKYVFTNRRFAEIFGYDPKQMVEKPLGEVLLPNDRQSVKELYKKMMLREEAPIQQIEAIGIKRDGTEIIVEADVRAIEYEGRPAFTTIVRDITERKQVEENYRQLLEDMNDGYVVIQDGKYVFANRKFYEMFRYEPGEDIEKPIIQFTMPDSQQVKAKKRKKGADSDEALVQRYEGKAIRKDGTKFLAEAINKFVQYKGKTALSVIVRDITKRKRAEEALTQSEKKYRGLAEGISDIFVALDKDLRYTYWNKAAEMITGISAKDALGKYHGHLFPDIKAGGDAIKAYLKVIRTKESKQLIHKIWFNGKDHTFELTMYPSGDGISIIAKDITERKRMEERYKQLLEDMNDGCIVVQDGEIVFANRGFGEIFGYKPDQVIGKSIGALTQDEDRQEQVELYEKFLRGESPPLERYESVGIRIDGTKIITDSSIRIIEYDNAPAVLVITRDITERKRMEESLRESEEKLRLIFESVPEGIIILDLEGKIVDINESVIQMLGYDSKGEIIERNGMELIAKRDRAQIKEDTEKTLEAGNLGVIRYTLVRKDGSEFPTAASAAVLRDNNGQPRGLVIIATDITLQQKRQDQLMLTDRLASIGQLASGIAHEINNPLTSVIGFSELLLERKFPRDVTEDLETIDKEAKRAAEVVRGLLTFVRNKGTEKTRVDINQIIKEVLQLRSYEQRISNIKVNTKLAPKLPQIKANGAHLQQVFINLVVNAEQAMTEAHGRGNLEINTEKAGDTVKISITDDGPGIEPENMKSLFNPFFTTKEVGKGTGLGLSICHGIVNEHGGRLYVESELGEGASFILELPIQAGVVESKQEVYD